jgi:ABC-type Mn2+/Zn2+ transport systems, permease components
MDFWSSIYSGEVGFVRNALLASILSSILFGIIGSIVSVKKITSLAGSISHSVLGGVGIALFVSANNILKNFSPILGAALFGIFTAIIIAFVSLKAKQKEDTVINALWAVGMGLGILFMAKTPQYADPMSYLFGNILLVSDVNLMLLALLDIGVVMLIVRFYPQIEAMIFDEDFAKTRGINTDLIFVILLVVTALAVVILQTFVGIIMVIAMFTLPAGIASYFSKSLSKMMFLATLLSAFFSIAGLWISWELDLPAGSVIVVFSGAVYLLASIVMAIKRKI